jgi:N-acetylmuramoyl-L-alanine amidase
VSFSRTRDVFVPLEIRPKLAKEWKADLFVSIHVNSSPAKEAQGTETYILSQEATDAAARKLALLENSIAGKAEAKASAVQDILWDVEQTAYLQDSAYLAADLQNSIIDNAHDILQSKKFNDQRANKIKGGWKNRGVRQAPFYVLNRAAMPAVLVEIGYLSNPKDRQLMNEKIFQESLAKALAEGVKKYRQACHQSP